MTAINESAQALGSLLAQAYIAYGFGLLLLAFWGGNLLLLTVLVYVVIRGRKARLFRRSCEVIYGLLNPMVYLVVLRPGFISYEPAFWQQLPLQSVAWILLGLVWTLRLAGASLAGRRPFALLYRLVLSAAGMCVVLFGIKDVLLLHAFGGQGLLAPPFWNEALGLAWGLSALAPLYLIPLVLVVDHLRAGFETPDTTSGFFLLQGAPARTMGVLVAVFAIASLIVQVWRPSDDATRRAVLDHREAILEAGRDFDVDPAVIASIMYVTLRYQITPFRGTAERLAMAAWLEDPTSNFLLGPSLNISIGLTQIKPVTAQTAARLVHRGGDMKTVREVPDLSWSLPKELTAALHPPWNDGGEKADVVAALLDDRSNLRTCALILAVYQVQWQADAHGLAIRRRPDILGTLFQIGFERSHPNAVPRSNTFGDQVQRVHDSPWLQETFRYPAAPL